MPKVKVYLKGLTSQEKQALILLLQEAGCEVVLLDEEAPLESEVEPIALAPDQNEVADDVLIILIKPGCEIDVEFKKAVMSAARQGCRVIGVWPKGATAGKVPTVLENYGFDVMTWNPKKMREAVQESQPQWETPVGTPRAEPVTKRNRC